ncbi:Adenine deaminase [Natronincola peptidivorans]|uniref:Adenine deaminase n=1 Tax=Natronincola peptidivorans TaxID=426128 RepID=A0A1I0F4L4_9FIRM|nr:adenine deaminase [Natronincola peptidivorans]SET52967.1 Adenine deaminase [Natronincola peptidivorans]
MREKLKRKIDIGAGRVKPELVLKNAKIVNVFSHEIIEGDIAIDDGKIVGIGEYEGIEVYEMDGRYVAPGLIDAHVHIESSMVTPGQFARGIVPRGTTTIIADPHEIANVCGVEGIEYILNASEKLPLNFYIMLPSCVPATSFENAGAILSAKELEGLIHHDRVLGMGELMDYPGVISAEDNILDKIMIAEDKKIDGHGPNIEGKELNAYIAAGVKTEHECSTVEEMQNRLRLGMYILIREGSAARNLETLIRGTTRENARRCLFCTDDKHPEDILVGGHIDNNLRLAVKEGIHPITALQMATINAAECYGLKDIGAIAPGYDADLIVLKDLENFEVLEVYKKGNKVAKNKKPLFDVEVTDHSKVSNTINMKSITKEDLEVKITSDIVNVIKLLPHSLVTEKAVRKVDALNGVFQYNRNLDILKLAVIERHKSTGNIGLGLVEDFKMKNGAIASTIAHDSHNIIVIGDNDEDMLLAIKEVEKIGGGITICSKGKVLKSLALPIGGLISDGTMEEVDLQLKEMLDIAYNQLAVNKNIDPFMTLSFLALPVIPEIKLTDMGLFNVTDFSFMDLSFKE